MEYSRRAPMPVSCAEAGRRGFVLERTAIGALVAALSLVALAHGAFAACGDNPDDANAVAAAQQAADSECDCTTAKTHHRYVRCVAGVAQAAVSSGMLSEECKAQLVGCAAGSTCGRPEAVRCCRTDASGGTHCHTMRRAASCRAPRAGSVCVGTTSTGSCAGDPCGSTDSLSAADQGPTIQCCHTVDSKGALCQLKTAKACQNNGGINMGPGTCSPNPCAGATTSTTSSTTTRPPTTTTTTSTTTTRPPTTTTTSTTTTTTTAPVATTTTTAPAATTTTTAPAATTTTTAPVATTTTTAPVATTTTTAPVATTTTTAPVATTTTTAPVATTTTTAPVATTTTTAPAATTTTTAPVATTTTTETTTTTTETTTTTTETTTTTAVPTTTTTTTTTTSTTTTTAPTCGSPNQACHDVCTTGAAECAACTTAEGAGTSGTETCVQAVCAEDPTCCDSTGTFTWDALCVSEVDTFCCPSGGTCCL